MNILIIAPDAPRDMLLTQTLLVQLKQRHARANIDVMAPESLHPLVRRMPEVRQVFRRPAASHKLSVFQQAAQQLREYEYAQAIVLHNGWKMALLTLLAGIPRRTGWRGWMRYGVLNDIRLFNNKQHTRLAERFVALADQPGRALPDPLPEPRLQGDPDNLAALIRRLELNTRRPVLALCPGSAAESRRWPPAHFARVAAEKIDQGWDVWLIAAGRDRSLCEAVCAELDMERQLHCTNLAGETAWDDIVDLLGIAKAVVANDSELAHIAAAVERPLVVLYGANGSEYAAPQSSDTRLLELDLDCRPCYQQECPRGHLQCLTELDPRQVVHALANVAPLMESD